MRLICPNCDAQYEVADNVIPDQGRDVQCSNCGSTWFQEPASALAAAARREVAPDPADSAPPPDDDDDTVPEAEDILDEPEDAGAEDAAEPEPEPEETTDAPAPSSTVSDDAAAVLREEAMRELKARLAEQPAIETQADLGLDALAPGPARDPRPEPQAPPPQDTAAAAVAGVVSASRNRLPDIEEINSTLDTSPANADAPTVDARPDLEKRRRTGFRLGFVTVVVLAVAAFAAYVYAPDIARIYPDADPALAAYVDRTDALRGQLDTWVSQTMQALTQMMSSVSANN